MKFNNKKIKKVLSKNTVLSPSEYLQIEEALTMADVYLHKFQQVNQLQGEIINCLLEQRLSDASLLIQSLSKIGDPGRDN
jgi:hypothetical protein